MHSTQSRATCCACARAGSVSLSLARDARHQPVSRRCRLPPARTSASAIENQNWGRPIERRLCLLCALESASFFFLRLLDCPQPQAPRVPLRLEVAVGFRQLRLCTGRAPALLRTEAKWFTVHTMDDVQSNGRSVISHLLVILTRVI